MEILLMMVVLGLLMYLMMIRPQQKRMNEQRDMLNRLTPGTRVLLISRVFGTIRATGDTQVVVELAPGVEVTCMKEAIMRVATDADEEFEYTDALVAPADEFATELTETPVDFSETEEQAVEEQIADEQVEAVLDVEQPAAPAEDVSAEPSTKATDADRA